MPPKKSKQEQAAKNKYAGLPITGVEGHEQYIREFGGLNLSIPTYMARSIYTAEPVNVGRAGASGAGMMAEHAASLVGTTPENAAMEMGRNAAFAAAVAATKPNAPAAGSGGGGGGGSPGFVRAPSGASYPRMTQERVNAGLHLMELLTNGNNTEQLENLLKFTRDELFQTTPAQIQQYMAKATELLKIKRPAGITTILKAFQNL